MEFVAAALDPRSFIVTVSGVPAGVRLRVRNVQADVDRACCEACKLVERTATVSVLSGLRAGRTTGAPVTMRIDCGFTGDGMQDPVLSPSVPRPASPDLYAALKVDTDDVRDVSSYANEGLQLARVAAAAVAREFLAEVGVDVRSFVTSIGTAVLREEQPMLAAPDYAPLDIETSPVRCPVSQASRSMLDEVKAAREAGDTLGGTFRIVATGLVAGLGSHVDPEANLNSSVAGAVLGVPDVIGVELGFGFSAASLKGSTTLDPVRAERNHGFVSRKNVAGGIEGGVTTGMPLVVGAAVRPPVPSAAANAAIDMETLEETDAPEQLFVCAAPQRAVAAESAVALVLANAYFDKFGSDTLTDIRSAVDAYRRRLKTASR